MGNIGTPNRGAQTVKFTHSAAVVCIGVLFEVHIGPGLLEARIAPVLLHDLPLGVEALLENLRRANPCIGEYTMRVNRIGVVVLDDERLAASEVPTSGNPLGDHHDAGLGTSSNSMRREKCSSWRPMSSMPLSSDSCA